MASVSIAGINKNYGETPVLRGVSLAIADGEFLTLLGPSGCGKSTLLRILAGLETQDAGSVSIGERVVDGLHPKRRDVAMVFQSYALYPHLTVASNMTLPLRMRRLSALQRLPLLGHWLAGTAQISAAIELEVARTAKALGIGHLLSRKPGQLSGGQRQRVAVGRAMVRHPAVFLMDEPLSNLDASLRVQMRAEIKDLHRRLGATFVYVTHDQAEAMTLSDRVAVMSDGELLQVAPPREIYADPDDRRVAELVGSPRINVLDGVARERGRIDVAGSMLAIEADALSGTSVALGIRAEAFHLTDHGGPGALTGSVRMVEHMGSDLFVHLDLAGVELPLAARLPAESAPYIAPGQTLHLEVRPDRVLLFARDGRRLRRKGTPAHASLTRIREGVR
ncbi:ABC transporter ATP-binding protein [Bradyrhizobium sp. ISRA443]|uniref:ABC transporter ATP-binding protein n=1 Tax=unclassified Bradyrhizobium TaxID=2631580 RepID=UPI002478CF2F|nr:MULTISPECIES: ABC transporter ATP-binding protein [unclassified Bradyrhizobium]WGR93358.1 ABC transporter ATP-binding protein [Bradyrhizobium sp. ISRA435]WGR97893.1 ABC transporter ATP-binding protein [Bradyrhizobium sp. ISRA436]WGS04783.1 ABC transporter ATP-binding protein [Bradyrhizobium sp. ISRA437]WGS11664.1 ABC transporter ATP-binding protein [Bradyrhizobium sp. ISRA443]